MGDATAIEWADATWNPIVGCSVVSPGCTNCYAMRLARRFDLPASPYEGTTETVNRKPVWTGRINVSPNVLMRPLQWRRPRRIFANSMGDLFHASVRIQDQAMVFAIMGLAAHHTFKVLTKRAQEMRDRLSDPAFEALARAYAADVRMERAGFIEPRADLFAWPLPNVWLGVSTEDQRRANDRIPLLLRTPAELRFISAEPLLGPIDLHAIDDIGDGVFESALTPKRLLSGSTTITLDWVIAGGESGPDARPMHPDWARDLRDQCADADVPYFFKQWGEWAPMPAEFDLGRGARLISPRGGECDPDHEADNSCQCEWMRRDGKRAAGRMLDGRTHDDFPAAHQGQRT